MVPNMQKAMKQLQKMQADMVKAQQELETKTVTATAGGGVVEVTFSGSLELKAIKISPEVAGEDLEMLQDLIIAAVNEGIKKAQELSASEMAKVTGNIKIPGMPGLF
ncbi:MAG: YbaB/EbfC family nucleoid-associated protein [Firmicutes bacterium]|nr:YbaB/EbfC family nucleoid-associated protein [Bacillota bacterium]